MKNKLNCILLVDNNRKNRYCNRFVIEAENCTNFIHSTRSALEALRYLISSGHLTNRKSELPFPDVILLEINMLEVDGWSFLDIYKEMKHNLINEPVIIMLSSAEEFDDNKLKASNYKDVYDIYINPLTIGMIKFIMLAYAKALSLRYWQ